MTDRELELRLKKAVDACTPDVLEHVMAECDHYKDNVIPMERKRNFRRNFISVAAGFILVIGLGIMVSGSILGHRVASIISLDVNPSIELRINSEEEVLEAAAENEDAKIILEGMQLEGLDIHTATNAIVGSLLKNGYIDELANSVLISVEDEDKERGTALQKTLTSEINSILEAASVNAAILSQYVDGEAVDETSQIYHISHGKAALIEQLLEANPKYSIDELVELSVNELNILLSNSHNHVDGIQSIGKATDQAYIGFEKANEIAFTHAGIDVKKIVNMKVEIDFEYHKMVYNVEFESEGVEFEYDIDATTGEVIEYKSESID